MQEVNGLKLGSITHNYRIKGINIMNIPEIKEILRQASVEVDIQGRKHLALFESDFERVAIELVKKLTLTDVSKRCDICKEKDVVHQICDDCKYDF
jgi:hypothetical protein